ncbi:hypothetical protein E2P81_ATG07469 [Venturia nashicola]|uniref:Uncharacterized protein n=1 Tax=Venturia nashicola TaxID=86259 RepID=A0A4Z1P713_9PEZI|nr:hypothetical protein E6O75_ATG07625 [Venturia nashicola]TLD31979.1 hypothetical protein E2P81_ATG07469 [Venturia nashicola]
MVKSFPQEIHTYESQLNPMTPRSPTTQTQVQPPSRAAAAHDSDAEESFHTFGELRPTTSQEQAAGEFYLSLTELTEFTENTDWDTNPQNLSGMKAKLEEMNERFDELFRLSRRKIVKAEIEAYLPQLDGFIHDHALGLRPSQIVSKTLKQATGKEDKEEWHTQHDLNLIFQTWDILKPLIKTLEFGWLKYLPRSNSPTRLTQPPRASEITFSHPEGLAVAMREGCWLEYKGDSYKASFSHFLDGRGGIEEAKRGVRRAKAVLLECEGGVRMGDSRAVVDVLFRAEKKLLAGTDGFLGEQGSGSPW